MQRAQAKLRVDSSSSRPRHYTLSRRYSTPNEAEKKRKMNETLQACPEYGVKNEVRSA